jgi:transketolase N-terminal domain/subunit
MTSISIPGPVTNDLRQALILRMGEVAQALEEASLLDRRKRSYEMFAEHFEQIDAIRDLFDALGWEHVEVDPAEIESVEIDLDEHREALEAGLDEATLILRTFTTEGSSDSRR